MSVFRVRCLPFSGGFLSHGAVCLALLAGLASAPAAANNYGESLGWQFQTSADRVNQAALLDLITKRRAGWYAAPIYTTNIARQYNCSIAPVATANSSGQSAVANSPTVTGASATSTGNGSSASAGPGPAGSIQNGQSNSGTIDSGVIGSTSSIAGGTASQALNSSQSNSGNQYASVAGSSACAFGALN